MRRRLPILVFFALVAMAALVLARVGSAPAEQAKAIAASGAIELSNSEEGQPIFAAAGIAPGESAQGTVTIEDTGSEPMALTLRRGELVDVPGPGGGLLSSRLQLTVDDISEPVSPREVYAGPLDTMPVQVAGKLEAGESRTFEFTATLPAAGASSFQNAVQGASVTVAYSWIAAEPSEGEEEGSGGETPSGGHPGGEAVVSPTGGGEENAGGVAAAGDLLTLTVPKIKPIPRRGRLVAWTRCDRSCRLTVRGRIRATGPMSHRVAKIRFAKKRLYMPGAQRPRIPIPRGLRHWLQETSGRKRLRANLRFIAVGTDGQRDVVRKTVRLHTRR
jgi:hypothetical protein